MSQFKVRWKVKSKKINMNAMDIYKGMNDKVNELIKKAKCIIWKQFCKWNWLDWMMCDSVRCVPLHGLWVA